MKYSQIRIRTDNVGSVLVQFKKTNADVWTKEMQHIPVGCPNHDMIFDLNEGTFFSAKNGDGDGIPVYPIDSLNK